ncbi:MAG: type II secretion system protein, partial [Christensenellaceae bacterium]
MNKNKRRGFTIIELVIVIAVIAVLMAVLIPTFVTLVKKSKLSNDQAQVT